MPTNEEIEKFTAALRAMIKQDLNKVTELDEGHKINLPRSIAEELERTPA